MRPVAGIAIAAFLGWMFAAPRTHAQVPPRSEAGQTLQIPDAQLAQGDAYFVLPGEDAQIIAVSDAPLQRIAITCRRVVGYFVAPFELQPGQSPLLAGALRIPVASLETGMESLNELLTSP